jgi:hypothetical protein
MQARSVEIEQRRLHVPIMDRSIGEPPPFVVVVQGPPQVSLLGLFALMVFESCLLSLLHTKILRWGSRC